ncbi:MAG TPA: S8 family serine peptidase [Vicinamibacterales bacterium]|nr:S8 family serine peptidase [Vicinamibacterales bacterium]
MKRWVGAALVLVVALFATARGQQPPDQQSAEFAPGEVLVQYRSNVQSVRRDAIVATRRGRLVRRLAQLDIDHISLDAADNVADAVARFRAMPEVVAAQPDYIRHVVQVQQPPPNDPKWLDGSLWGMIKIHAQSAWNTLNARGDGSVVIMDIDTGVNYNHEDLAANIWTNPGEIAGNGIDDDGDGYVDDVHGINTIAGAARPGDPLDDNGHGTHTAGTIAAVGNNSLGVVGVNWNAKILACKFLNASGNGSDSAAAACLNYAVLLKTQKSINIRVTSNSWGGYRNGGNPSVLQNAFTAAGAAGILSVAAAGNGNAQSVGLNIDLNGNQFDPASLSLVVPSVIAVAASDSNDNRASFSNYGPNTVLLAAPGVGIWSTYFNPSVPANNTYQSLSGTSMATPHVAGTAALLSALSPSLNSTQLTAIIRGSVDVLSQWGTAVSSGGRLNVFQAASAVAPQTQFTLTPSTLSVSTGSSLSISWTAPAGRSATDWVGLFHVGDPNTVYGWYTYTGGATSGTVNLTAPYPPGQYEFRYLLNNGYQDTAHSATVTVTQGGNPFTLTPSPLSVAGGGALSISWTAPSGESAKDWVGLFRVGDPNTVYGWFTHTGGATSGTANLTAPLVPGQYEFRYLLNDGYQDTARSAAVTVTQGQVSFTLTASPLSVAGGGALSVSWTAPGGESATDWIGLFHVGDPNTIYGWFAYTNGATSGTFNLTAPTQPGQYEFRYLLNNGYTDTARSAAITVTQGQSAFTLTPSPLSLPAGQTASISWTAPAGEAATDWIGLFHVGDPNTAAVWWAFTNGATSGSLTTTPIPDGGQYEFRYFLHNTYTQAGTNSVPVTVTAVPIVLTAAPASVSPGGQVTVSWTAPAGRPTTDWIGLYRVGDPDTSAIWWQYTQGTTSGSFTVTVPSTSGQYEFRYFRQNLYSLVTRSNTFSVAFQ